MTVINRSIPLSSGNNFVIDEYNLMVNRVLPLALGVPVPNILLGNRSSASSPGVNTSNDPLANNSSDMFSRMDIISYQKLPVYNDQLISASLSLSCISISGYTNSFGVKIHILSEINTFPVDSYYSILGLSKYSGSITHTINAGTNNINITPLIDYATSLAGWSANSTVALLIEAPSSGDRLVYVNPNQSNISVQYNAIIPSTPLNVGVLPDYNQVLASWNAPTDDGGSPILDYTVQYRILNDNNAPVGDWLMGPTTTSRSVAINNLDNAYKYIVRVSARNSVGPGPYSTVSPIVSPNNRTAPRVSSTYNDANYTRIRLRRDTATAWSGANPVLGKGEAGYETDTRFLKVGDNTTEWNNLQYVRVPNNSIQFPPYPDVNLLIGDTEVGLSNTRIIANLSNNEQLNIVGKNGITSTYSDANKAIVLSLTQTYNPIYSGTLYSPTTSGQPGNVAHDQHWIYLCVQNNLWKKFPIEEYWFDPASVSVSNVSGLYPSVTNIMFSGSNMIVTSDGDPFPAKAGHNLTNDGISDRTGFFQSYFIEDQNYRKVFRYRGPSFSSNPMSLSGSPAGVMSNGVVLCGPYTPSNTLNIFNAPSGLKFNKVFFSQYFKLDGCGGEVILDRSYRYLHGGFLKNCWANNLFVNSNNYYAQSAFSGDYFRHTDGHSKIIGFCFDGYPIYGPYTYANPDVSGNPILATSSYIAKTTDDHRPPNWKFNNALVIDSVNYMLTTGAFLDDFEFVEGSGVLDQYNGRFSITPEYPEGVYAYYLTFTDSSLSIPQYPYIIGPYSRQQRQ